MSKWKPDKLVSLLQQFITMYCFAGRGKMKYVKEMKLNKGKIRYT
jgi:hypothetical protein